MVARTRRRLLVGMAGLGIAASGGLLAYGSRKPTRVPRIGFLAVLPASSPNLQAQIQAFRQGLHELSYVEGQTVTIEWRHADGNFERVPSLAHELVSLPVDLIVATGGADRLIADSVTTVPVVFAVSGNLLGQGIVQSLARPGGNVTGLDLNTSLLGGKQLDLLKQTVPHLTRAALLWQTATPSNLEAVIQEREETARGLGFELLRLRIETPTDLPAIFKRAVEARVEALTTTSTAVMTEWRAQIVEQATSHRLPAIYPVREFVLAGGLMSYGGNVPDFYRRAATYVDKILKGAKPGDLPIEQPASFELPINLRAAEAIGLAIPESVLIQATELIQ